METGSAAPWGATVERYRRLAVGLTRTATDPGLLRYAAMVARPGTAAEVRFVHVLPDGPPPDPEAVREELRAAVRDHFTDVPESVATAFDVLPGPLTDRLLAHAGESHTEGGRVTAPMPGKVVSFGVKAGDKVSKGQALAVMEAMKMEHTIAAPADGVVQEVLYAPGDQVAEGAELLKIGS